MDTKLITQMEMRSKKGTTFYIEFYGPGVAKVKLLSFTSKPVWTIATAIKGYTGKYDEDVLKEDEIDQLLKDISATKNQTPLEMISMFWLLKDVSRAFTHQIVRYRVGTSFVQESMRFVGLQNTYKILATHLDVDSFNTYAEGAAQSISHFVDLVENGVPPEDARGLIPTNILTQMFFGVNLRALQGIIPNRLCCQAQQGEWQPILLAMRRQIQVMMSPKLADLLKAPYELGHPCGFRASFDRPCIWQKEKRDDADSDL